MINISIITQEDKFFIPQNIKILIDNERINVKSIHVIEAKGSLEKKKNFFLKSFLFSGAIQLGLKYVYYEIIDRLDSFLNYKLLSNKKSIKSLAKENNIKFSCIKDPNNQDFIKYLKSINLDFIVSYSAPLIFKSFLLNIPKYSCINLHCSLLPDYSGIMPSFWALYFKEEYTGCSVHLMDTKIDNGKIVLQKKINILGVNSIYKLNSITKKYGGELMQKSIIGLVDKTVELKPNHVDASKYYTWPSKNEIKYFVKNGGRIY
jgi:methionyl-tRNA formyltransferase